MVQQGILSKKVLMALAPLEPQRGIATNKFRTTSPCQPPIPRDIDEGLLTVGYCRHDRHPARAATLNQ